MDVRPAIFAKMGWYPEDREECLTLIQKWSGNGIDVKATDVMRLGGIVPHAGWYFSGEIACTVFRGLKPIQPQLVIIFGKHLSVSSPRTIMVEGLWETPLGDIEIDTTLGSVLTKEFDFTIETASRFEQDNTIELQLPFIKYFFPEAKLLPVGLPPTQESLSIASRCARLCHEMGITAIAVGSTDLTHYGPTYGFVPAGIGREATRWSINNDERVIEHMISMEPSLVMEEALANHNACCPGACASAITVCKELGAKTGEKLMYASSYDKSPGSSFVGYVGVIF